MLWEDGSMKILLADDTELIREGLKSMLLQLPNPAICPEIRTACNGAEALSLMREHPVDLLITDIRMPDVDGIELMRQCRSQWANTSIVVISGYDDFKYAQQAIEYGASAYLLKPVDKQELYRVVEKAWQSANARRATIVCELLAGRIVKRGNIGADEANVSVPVRGVCADVDWLPGNRIYWGRAKSECVASVQ